MTEDDARSWMASRVPRETMVALERFVQRLQEEMPHQNLISTTSADQIWARHIVDSAQLAELAPPGAARWLDLGSGAGFPGIVVGLQRADLRLTLVESRRRRIDFLRDAVQLLKIEDRVEIAGQRLELLPIATQDVISARAFAPLERLLPLAHRFASAETTWLLPKGRSASSELEAVRGTWQGVFRVVPSVTDSEAAIIVAKDVQPLSQRQVRR